MELCEVRCGEVAVQNDNKNLWYVADCFVWEVGQIVHISVYFKLLWTGYIRNMQCPPRQWEKKHQFVGKITSIKTSWSLPLRCWQQLEASRVVQCASVPLWFTPNNIASDCPFFYWIRPALLMQKEINKQTVLCLLLGWLNYRVNSRDGLFTTHVQADVFTPHLHWSISIAQKIETICSIQHHRTTWQISGAPHISTFNAPRLCFPSQPHADERFSNKQTIYIQQILCFVALSISACLIIFWFLEVAMVGDDEFPFFSAAVGTWLRPLLLTVT